MFLLIMFLVGVFSYQVIQPWTLSAKGCWSSPLELNEDVKIICKVTTFCSSPTNHGHHDSGDELCLLSTMSTLSTMLIVNDVYNVNKVNSVNNVYVQHYQQC